MGNTHCQMGKKLQNDENCVKTTNLHQKNNILDGPHKSWFSNGQLEYDDFYINGKVIKINNFSLVSM